MRKRKAGKAYFAWLGALDSNPLVYRPVFKSEFEKWGSSAQWAYTLAARQTSTGWSRPAKGYLLHAYQIKIVKDIMRVPVASLLA